MHLLAHTLGVHLAKLDDAHRRQLQRGALALAAVTEEMTQGGTAAPAAAARVGVS